MPHPAPRVLDGAIYKSHPRAIWDHKEIMMMIHWFIISLMSQWDTLLRRKCRWFIADENDRWVSLKTSIIVMITTSLFLEDNARIMIMTLTRSCHLTTQNYGFYFLSVCWIKCRWTSIRNSFLFFWKKGSRSLGSSHFCLAKILQKFYHCKLSTRVQAPTTFPLLEWSSASPRLTLLFKNSSKFKSFYKWGPKSFIGLGLCLFNELCSEAITR